MVAVFEQAGSADAPQRNSGITDLARWSSCGIPSAWRSTTTSGGPGAALDGTGACVMRLCPWAVVW